MRAWTDYPIAALGDAVLGEAPIRECLVLSYDGNKYCRVQVAGITIEIKAGYLYQEPGRIGEAPPVGLSALEALPPANAKGGTRNDLLDPQYWAGHDDAVIAFTQIWRDALTLSIPRRGAVYEPLGVLYRETEALRQALEEAEHRARLSEGGRAFVLGTATGLRELLQHAAVSLAWYAVDGATPDEEPKMSADELLKRIRVSLQATEFVTAEYIAGWAPVQKDAG